MLPPKLTVVCWKWKPAPGYRSQFNSTHVNVFANMARRHYHKPVEVVCVTDDAEGITNCDRIIPLWNDFAALRSPHDGNGPVKRPACYRRLKMFAADAGQWLGERILSLDLDTVIVGPLDKLLDRREDFVAWGDTNPLTYYNGGMILFTAGARPQLWDDFRADPDGCILKAKQARHHGSDQAWISYCLGPKEAKFTRMDGVYSYRNHIRVRPMHSLPSDARLVSFHGNFDPWAAEPQRIQWVRDNWR